MNLEYSEEFTAEVCEMSLFICLAKASLFNNLVNETTHFNVYLYLCR